ncbi:hypothetical protein GS507_29035 [Rhodococcus hoagii]|nr:hypothetical protein [Prescottella equi]
MNGHVNNARVVTLLEELRIAAYLDWTDSTPDAGHPRVVRTLSVDYRHPVHTAAPLTGACGYPASAARLRDAARPAPAGPACRHGRGGGGPAGGRPPRSGPSPTPPRRPRTGAAPDVTASSECEAAPGHNRRHRPDACRPALPDTTGVP